jgi:hypothetical protein
MAKSITYVKTFDGVERERVAFLPAEHRQLVADGWEPAGDKSKPKSAEETAPRTRRAPADEPAESKS